MNTNEYVGEAISLLEKLIAIPSFSTEEDETAGCLAAWMEEHEIEFQRTGNNLWSKNKYYDPAKPNLLLNSHHDTVRPNKGYTLDPFQPTIKNGRLYGLGSNDAGGCLVSLLQTFRHFFQS